MLLTLKTQNYQDYCLGNILISLIIISMFKKPAFAVDVAFILNFCPFQSDKIATILKAAGVSVEPYWPCTYMYGIF